ncbi:MAG: (d)CMP kinase [Trueperaceae bacterium]
MNTLIITIDGPAASGKSSVAKGIAERLGIPFVSSGLLYRAATYLALKHGLDPNDERGLLELLTQCHIHLKAKGGEANEIHLDDKDITNFLHTDSIDIHVSAVAKLPRIRAWVDDRLRDIEGPFVIDGRDMGTAVFPNAPYKFYLDAPADIRAGRRVGERVADLAAVAEALKRRDTLDAEQSKAAPDALHVNTEHLNLHGVIEHILMHIQRRGGPSKSSESLAPTVRSA